MAIYRRETAQRILDYVNEQQGQSFDDRGELQNPTNWNRPPQLCVTLERVTSATQRFEVGLLGHTEREAQHVILIGDVFETDTFTLSFSGWGVTVPVPCIDGQDELNLELARIFGAGVIATWMSGRYVIEFTRDSILTPPEYKCFVWSSDADAIVTRTKWPAIRQKEPDCLAGSPIRDCFPSASSGSPSGSLAGSPSGSEADKFYLPEGTLGTILFMPHNGGYLFHASECERRNVEGFDVASSVGSGPVSGSAS